MKAEKSKILIVEDNELNLRLFQDLLSLKKNIEVFTLKDGNQFITKAKNIMPDLILMDIQLPDISGIDLIKQIKFDLVTKSIPIIAITAFSIKAEEEKILQSGCEAYISKPISIDRFFRVIERFLEPKYFEA